MTAEEVRRRGDISPSENPYERERERRKPTESERERERERRETYRPTDLQTYRQKNHIEPLIAALLDSSQRFEST